MFKNQDRIKSFPKRKPAPQFTTKKFSFSTHLRTKKNTATHVTVSDIFLFVHHALCSIISISFSSERNCLSVSARFVIVLQA